MSDLKNDSRVWRNKAGSQTRWLAKHQKLGGIPRLRSATAVRFREDSAANRPNRGEQVLRDATNSPETQSRDCARMRFVVSKKGR